MIADLTEYRIKRQMAAIDSLIAELVVIRQYISSTRVGLTYCRKHLTGETPGVSLCCQAGDLKKNEELLLLGLRRAEKKVKRQLAQATRELAMVYRRDLETKKNN